MRRFPALKSIAGATCLVFAVTTVMPAGWAWARPADDTMRVQEAVESPQTHAGLEEALGHPPTSSLTDQEMEARTRFAEERHAAAKTAQPRSFWRHRAVQPMRRVTVLGMMALQLLGVRSLTAPMQGAAARPAAPQAVSAPATNRPAAPVRVLVPGEPRPVPLPTNGLSADQLPARVVVPVPLPTSTNVEGLKRHTMAPPTEFRPSTAQRVINWSQRAGARMYWWLQDTRGLWKTPTWTPPLVTNATPIVMIWAPQYLESMGWARRRAIFDGIQRQKGWVLYGTGPAVQGEWYEAYGTPKPIAAEVDRHLNEIHAVGGKAAPLMGRDTWGLRSGWGEGLNHVTVMMGYSKFDWERAYLDVEVWTTAAWTSALDALTNASTDADRAAARQRLKNLAWDWYQWHQQVLELLPTDRNTTLYTFIPIGVSTDTNRFPAVLGEALREHRATVDPRIVPVPMAYGPSVNFTDAVTATANQVDIPQSRLGALAINVAPPRTREEARETRYAEFRRDPAGALTALQASLAGARPREVVWNLASDSQSVWAWGLPPARVVSGPGSLVPRLQRDAVTASYYLAGEPMTIRPEDLHKPAMPRTWLDTIVAVTRSRPQAILGGATVPAAAPYRMAKMVTENAEGRWRVEFDAVPLRQEGAVIAGVRLVQGFLSAVGNVRVADVTIVDAQGRPVVRHATATQAGLHDPASLGPLSFRVTVERDPRAPWWQWFQHVNSSVGAVVGQGHWASESPLRREKWGKVYIPPFERRGTAVIPLTALAEWANITALKLFGVENNVIEQVGPGRDPRVVAEGWPYLVQDARQQLPLVAKALAAWATHANEEIQKSFRQRFGRAPTPQELRQALDERLLDEQGIAAAIDRQALALTRLGIVAGGRVLLVVPAALAEAGADADRWFDALETLRASGVAAVSLTLPDAESRAVASLANAQASAAPPLFFVGPRATAEAEQIRRIIQTAHREGLMVYLQVDGERLDALRRTASSDPTVDILDVLWGIHEDQQLGWDGIVLHDPGRNRDVRTQVEHVAMDQLQVPLLVTGAAGEASDRGAWAPALSITNGVDGVVRDLQRIADQLAAPVLRWQGAALLEGGALTNVVGWMKTLPTVGSDVATNGPVLTSLFDRVLVPSAEALQQQGVSASQVTNVQRAAVMPQGQLTRALRDSTATGHAEASALVAAWTDSLEHIERVEQSPRFLSVVERFIEIGVARNQPLPVLYAGRRFAEVDLPMPPTQEVRAGQPLPLAIHLTHRGTAPFGHYTVTVTAYHEGTRQRTGGTSYVQLPKDQTVALPYQLNDLPSGQVRVSVTAVPVMLEGIRSGLPSGLEPDERKLSTARVALNVSATNAVASTPILAPRDAGTALAAFLQREVVRQRVVEGFDGPGLLPVWDAEYLDGLRRRAVRHFDPWATVSLTTTNVTVNGAPAVKLVPTLTPHAAQPAWAPPVREAQGEPIELITPYPPARATPYLVGGWLYIAASGLFGLLLVMGRSLRRAYGEWQHAARVAQGPPPTPPPAAPPTGPSAGLEESSQAGFDVVTLGDAAVNVVQPAGARQEEVERPVSTITKYQALVREGTPFGMLDLATAQDSQTHRPHPGPPPQKPAADDRHELAIHVEEALGYTLAPPSLLWSGRMTAHVPLGSRFGRQDAGWLDRVLEKARTIHALNHHLRGIRVRLAPGESWRALDEAVAEMRTLHQREQRWIELDFGLPMAPTVEQWRHVKQFRRLLGQGFAQWDPTARTIQVDTLALRIPNGRLQEFMARLYAESAKRMTPEREQGFWIHQDVMAELYGPVQREVAQDFTGIPIHLDWRPWTVIPRAYPAPYAQIQKVLEAHPTYGAAAREIFAAKKALRNLADPEKFDAAMADLKARYPAHKKVIQQIVNAAYRQRYGGASLLRGLVVGAVAVATGGWAVGAVVGAVAAVISPGWLMRIIWWHMETRSRQSTTKAEWSPRLLVKTLGPWGLWALVGFGVLKGVAVLTGAALSPWLVGAVVLVLGWKFSALLLFWGVKTIQLIGRLPFWFLGSMQARYWAGLTPPRLRTPEVNAVLARLDTVGRQHLQVFNDFAVPWVVAAQATSYTFSMFQRRLLDFIAPKANAEHPLGFGWGMMTAIVVGILSIPFGWAVLTSALVGAGGARVWYAFADHDQKRLVDRTPIQQLRRQGSWNWRSPATWRAIGRTAASLRWVLVPLAGLALATAVFPASAAFLGLLLAHPWLVIGGVFAVFHLAPALALWGWGHLFHRAGESAGDARQRLLDGTPGSRWLAVQRFVLDTLPTQTQGLTDVLFVVRDSSSVVISLSEPEFNWLNFLEQRGRWDMGDIVVKTMQWTGHRLALSMARFLHQTFYQDEEFPDMMERLMASRTPRWHTSALWRLVEDPFLDKWTDGPVEPALMGLRSLDDAHNPDDAELRRQLVDFLAGSFSGADGHIISYFYEGQTTDEKAAPAVVLPFTVEVKSEVDNIATVSLDSSRWSVLRMMLEGNPPSLSKGQKLAVMRSFMYQDRGRLRLETARLELGALRVTLSDETDDQYEGVVERYFPEQRWLNTVVAAIRRQTAPVPAGQIDTLAPETTRGTRPGPRNWMERLRDELTPFQLFGINDERNNTVVMRSAATMSFKWLKRRNQGGIDTQEVEGAEPRVRMAPITEQQLRDQLAAWRTGHPGAGLEEDAIAYTEAMAQRLLIGLRDHPLAGTLLHVTQDSRAHPQFNLVHGMPATEAAKPYFARLGIATQWVKGWGYTDPGYREGPVVLRAGDVAEQLLSRPAGELGVMIVQQYLDDRAAGRAPESFERYVRGLSPIQQDTDTVAGALLDPSVELGAKWAGTIAALHTRVGDDAFVTQMARHRYALNASQGDAEGTFDGLPADRQAGLKREVQRDLAATREISPQFRDEGRLALYDVRVWPHRMAAGVLIGLGVAVVTAVATGGLGWVAVGVGVAIGGATAALTHWRNADRGALVGGVSAAGLLVGAKLVFGGAITIFSGVMLVGALAAAALAAALGWAYYRTVLASGGVSPARAAGRRIVAGSALWGLLVGLGVLAPPAWFLGAAVFGVAAGFAAGLVNRAPPALWMTGGRNPWWMGWFAGLVTVSATAPWALALLATPAWPLALLGWAAAGLTAVLGVEVVFRSLVAPQGPPYSRDAQIVAAVFGRSPHQFDGFWDSSTWQLRVGMPMQEGTGYFRIPLWMRGGVLPAGAPPLSMLEALTVLHVPAHLAPISAFNVLAWRRAYAVLEAMLKAEDTLAGYVAIEEVRAGRRRGASPTSTPLPPAAMRARQTLIHLSVELKHLDHSLREAAALGLGLGLQEARAALFRSPLMTGAESAHTGSLVWPDGRARPLDRVTDLQRYEGRVIAVDDDHQVTVAVRTAVDTETTFQFQDIRLRTGDTILLDRFVIRDASHPDDVGLWATREGRVVAATDSTAFYRGATLMTPAVLLDNLWTHRTFDMLQMMWEPLAHGTPNIPGLMTGWTGANLNYGRVGGTFMPGFANAWETTLMFDPEFAWRGRQAVEEERWGLARLLASFEFDPGLVWQRQWALDDVLRDAARLRGSAVARADRLLQLGADDLRRDVAQIAVRLRRLPELTGDFTKYLGPNAMPELAKRAALQLHTRREVLQRMIRLRDAQDHWERDALPLIQRLPVVLDRLQHQARHDLLQRHPAPVRVPLARFVPVDPRLVLAEAMNETHQSRAAVGLEETPTPSVTVPSMTTAPMITQPQRVPIAFQPTEPAWTPPVQQTPPASVVATPAKALPATTTEMAAAAPPTVVTVAPQVQAQMALEVMAVELNLAGQETVTVAAVPVSAVIQANPALAAAAGQIIAFGDARFVIVPDDPADIIVSLMSETKATVVIRTYGGPEEAALDAFEAQARRAGFQVEPRQPLTGTTLEELLRQILANLSGLEPSAVPDFSVRELVEALTLKALA